MYLKHYIMIFTWTQRTLGEVATVFDGPHATPAKTETGPWYLSISSLVDGRVDLEQSAHMSEDDLATWTRRVSPLPGDTLFSYETRIGQAGYWGLEEPAALGRRMGLLRPAPEVIDAGFLTLSYLGPQFQDVISENTVRGGTVERIPIADMSNWQLVVPDLAEQCCIAGFFQLLDNMIAIGLRVHANSILGSVGHPLTECGRYASGSLIILTFSSNVPHVTNSTW